MRRISVVLGGGVLTWALLGVVPAPRACSCVASGPDAYEIAPGRQVGLLVERGEDGR